MQMARITSRLSWRASMSSLASKERKSTPSRLVAVLLAPGGSADGHVDACVLRGAEVAVPGSKELRAPHLEAFGAVAAAGRHHACNPQGRLAPDTRIVERPVARVVQSVVWCSVPYTNARPVP